MENEKHFGKLLDACNAVLMFYRAGQWTRDDGIAWKKLVGADEATTKVLCDFVRAAIGDDDDEGGGYAKSPSTLT